MTKAYPRAAHDWYVEPSRVTRQLAAVESFTGPIHDPACGMGRIPMALEAAGHMATGSDIVERAPGAPWFLGVSDFIRTRQTFGARNVVSNPPYYKGFGIIAYILGSLAAVDGKVCIFCEARFLFAKHRGRDFFSLIRPDRIYYISTRPSCPPGEVIKAGGKATGAKQDCIWMVWDEREGRAEGHWLV